MGTNIRIHLLPWVRMREAGWVNGDGHVHLPGDDGPNLPFLKEVAQIAEAQGVDFVFANQDWGGYDEAKWNEVKEATWTDRFQLHFGAEMPKYRFGHTWWMGPYSNLGYFKKGMDWVYYDFFKTPRTSFSDEDRQFPSIPSVELVPRFRHQEGVAAIFAHPTSWWWHNSERTKYVTNVSTELVFSLFGGGLWDGMVVSGYDIDHYGYQNLWFHVLNEGYRMTPFAELDGGFFRHHPTYSGSVRTYIKIDGEMNPESIAKGVCKGHTMVTSGPILFANIDRKYQVGEMVPLDGQTHHLSIQAFASGDQEDYLTYVVLFRNGKINHLWDVRKEKPRHLHLNHEISEVEKSWYVVKSYGKATWLDPSMLDVMKVFSEIEKIGTDRLPKHHSHSMALTSPFYFGEWASSPMISDVELNIVNADGSPAEDVKVEVIVLGKKMAEHHLEEGSGRFNMLVHSILKITSSDGEVFHRGLFMDYPHYQEILAYLVEGNWIKETGFLNTYQPGRIPWSAFRFRESKVVLSHPIWTIELTPNERDPLWEEFESLFNN